MKSLKEILIAECELEDWGSTDSDTLEECLRESFPVVWEGEHDEHRWRTEYSQVREVSHDGATRFFKHSAFISKTQEGDAEGCGYYFEGIDSVIEVYPKEVTTIIYVTG